MAYTTIDDPSAHFQTKLYTGNGSTQSITNDGNSDLQPDLVWTKARSDTSHNALVDSSRGTSIQIYTNLTYQDDPVSGVTAFNTDGFTLGSNGTANADGVTHVAWQWKANGGTTTAFSESGNNPGGTYQTNTTAGFSIVTYTGTGAAGTVTHGLGVAPKFIIIKNRDVADPWAVYYGDATDYLVLNTTAATVDNAAWWNDTAPSSTVFTVNTDHSVNADGEDYIAYCFAEKQGYSKFGSYVGNGVAGNGPFVYTGFKPAWIMVKPIDAALDWFIYDNRRAAGNTVDARYNEVKSVLFANSNSAGTGTSYAGVDLVSNGFKWINGGAGGSNQSGITYIYMAFAENPFVTSTGVPATAR
jgi:hypothetical protein